MRQMLVIAKRELLERVRSKWFVIITLLGPLGMIALIIVPVLIASSGSAGAKVQIADATGTLGAPLATKLTTELAWQVTQVPPTTTDDELRARIARSEINGFVRIPKDALDGGEIDYSGDNASSQAVGLQVFAEVNSVVQSARGEHLGLTSTQMDALLKPPVFRALHTTGETEGASGAATFIIGYILAFTLYFVITIYCVTVMRSVVQEKTSRVMELMCAAAKPRTLLGGKILGVGAAGLIQITAWIVMGGITLAYRDEILGLFGVHGTGASALPPLHADAIAVFVIYFIVGFFFYSALFAAAGSMVSSEQDTQQVQMPITIILMIGIVCINVVSNDPRSGAAIAMTNVPVWSPMLMPMRYVLGGATLGEVAISLAILVISTFVVIQIAARIYRVGVLMYGKRPSLSEVVRWVRHG
jgi:ABC-2 type transport system permease protein